MKGEKIMEWSKIMQPPEFLEATRISLLSDDFIDLAVKYSGLASGMRVLEVGCGTGYFSRYLSKGVRGVHFTGLDIDRGFIEAALPVHGDNTCEYIQGSAYALPFADASFDGVFSHTFFNCADQPKKAIKEMLRVCRPGGRVTAVVPMSLTFETWHKGFYPEECTWTETIEGFQRKMFQALDEMGCGTRDFNKGFSASKLPRFFYVSGLRDIRLCPLPRSFSLSNSALSVSTKRAYVLQLYEGEKKKLQNIVELTRFQSYVPKEECDAYLEALAQRRDFWLAHLTDNSVWDWFGGSALLASGRREA